MAILYKANETQFNHLGLGPLNDAVSILVTEERNGIFELEMKYPVSGKLFKELKNDRLIKADAGHKLKDQRFKIIRISKPLKGIVTVYAEHVSYLSQDLALKPKVTFSGNARQALEHWKANLVDDNPFSVWSDISTTGNIDWTIDEVENARRALGGVQGSILDVYGGEYLFDNYDIYLYQKRGVNSELLIAYGRNLVDLEQEEEIANTYTSIYPYSIYTDDDGNERMVTLPEYYIDSEHVDKYARRKILVVDFTTDEIETVSALRNAARRYIKDNDVGVPRVNLKIQYIDLAKTLDYKDLELYEEVNLCDNVMIYFEKYDINTTAKVIKVVWDALNERYDSIEVGEARASLSQAIDTVVDGKVHNVEKLAMQTLRTADGKNTIYFGLEEPLATEYDLKKNDIWYRIVDGEFTRTYRYDGAVWQLIVDMDSAEAKQLANEAKQDAEQSLTTANHAINTAQAGFDKAQENATAIDGLGLQIGDVETGLTTISGTVQGLQTTVTDLDGNVSNLTQLSNVLQTTVSSLQDEFDNLEIGGRNLLPNSEKIVVNKGLERINLTTHIKKGSDLIVSGNYRVLEGNPEELSIRIRDINGNHILGGVRNVVVSDSGTSYFELVFKDVGDDVHQILFYSDASVNNDNVVEYSLASLYRGNVPMDWSPAPEDMATQSQITQLSDAINLRVQKGDVINQINLDTSGVLISGKKLILDGDTTVLGTFKLDGSAHIQDASIGTAQIAFIDAAKINSGELNTNNITIFGGNTTEYTNIQGPRIESRGNYTRTWFGETKNHDVKMVVANGHLRMENIDEDRRLYFTDDGISTYIYGSNEDDGGLAGSGVIEFFSHMYSSEARGLTLYSNRGVVALKTATRDIILDSDREIDLSTNRGSVRFKLNKDNRPGTNELQLYVTNASSSSDTDLQMLYGAPDTGYGSGLRFSKSGHSTAYIFATDGTGTKGTGNFWADGFYGDLRAKAVNAYVRAPLLRIVDHDTATDTAFGDLQFMDGRARSMRINTSGSGTRSNFYIGVSTGEARIVTNQTITEGMDSGSSYGIVYRPIRASSFNQSSSRDYKTNIEAYDGSALSVINDLSVVTYNLKDDLANGIVDKKIGFISEDSSNISTNDGKAIDTYKLTALNTKAIQELDRKLSDNVEFLKLKVQYLEQKIKLLEAS